MESDQIDTDFYQVDDLVINTDEEDAIGSITEKDKLLAAKQILCGIGFIYLFTVVAFLTHPENGDALLEICKTVLPPLATLIIAFYFKDKTT